MSRFDRSRNYGRRDGPLEKISQKMADIGSDIMYAVQSTTTAVQDFISPRQRQYGYHYPSRHSQPSVDWGFVASRGAVAAAVAAAMTTAYEAGPTLFDKVFNNHASTTEVNPHQFTPTEIPKPPESPPQSIEMNQERSEWRSGITLNYDTNGALSSYQMDGKELVTIDPIKFAEMQLQAITDHETQLLANIQLPTSQPEKQKPTSTTEKPITTELPSDVVSTEELTQRGIKIISANESVQMYIRQSAFDNGNLLEAYQKDGYRKMTVVLVDSPYLTTRAMQGEQYEGYREVVAEKEKVIVDYRAQEISKYQTYITDTRTLLHDALAAGKTDEVEAYDSQLLTLKSIILQYEQMTDLQIATEAGLSESFAGLYNSRGPDGESVIYISIGKVDLAESTEQTSILIRPDGSIDVVTTITGSSSIDMTPTQDQTHPSPNDFIAKDNPGPSQEGQEPDESYPYGGQTPGQVARHEIKHDSKIKINPTGQEWFDRSEYRTDMDAMDTIRQAYDLWIEKGDNSQYYFIFRLPDGSFILTKNENNPSPI